MMECFTESEPAKHLKDRKTSPKKLYDGYDTARLTEENKEMAVS